MTIREELIRKIGDIIEIESITDQHAKGHRVINADMVAEEIVWLLESERVGRRICRGIRERFSRLMCRLGFY